MPSRLSYGYFKVHKWISVLFLMTRFLSRLYSSQTELNLLTIGKPGNSGHLYRTRQQRAFIPTTAIKHKIFGFDRQDLLFRPYSQHPMSNIYMHNQFVTCHSHLRMLLMSNWLNQNPSDSSFSLELLQLSLEIRH